MSRIDLEAYLELHRKLTASVEGLSEEQLTKPEAEGKWSITEVLAHLQDHNIVVSFRIRDILAGTEARLPAFDQDRWVSGQKANEASAHDILTAYQTLLQYNGQLLARLSEPDFEKTGINFKGETVSIADIVRGFVKHADTHLRQIERIQQALSAPQA